MYFLRDGCLIFVDDPRRASRLYLPAFVVIIASDRARGRVLGERGREGGMGRDVY